MNNKKLERLQKKKIVKVATVAILEYNNLGTLSTFPSPPIIVSFLFPISLYKHLGNQ